MNKFDIPQDLLETFERKTSKEVTILEYKLLNGGSSKVEKIYFRDVEILGIFKRVTLFNDDSDDCIVENVNYLSDSDIKLLSKFI